MIRFILAALLCVSCYAVDVGRVMAIHTTKDGEVHMYCGTVFRHGAAFVTAAHTLEDAEIVKVELNSGEWVKAEIVKQDKNLDIAFLKFKGELTAYDVKGLAFVGSIMATPVAVLPAKDGRFKGFNQGGSGGPVVFNNTVLFMALMMNTGDNGCVFGVPIQVVEQVMP